MKQTYEEYCAEMGDDSFDEEAAYLAAREHDPEAFEEMVRDDLAGKS
jgi:hypothetical protein